MEFSLKTPFSQLFQSGKNGGRGGEILERKLTTSITHKCKNSILKYNKGKADNVFQVV